jgi:branched-chain amino acid transport system ATP-binding protein
MDLLSVNSVNKSYGGVVANTDVSLEVPEGKIVGVIGPNGSGKTTLFNSIVGHHPIDSGEIYFNNQEISRLTIPKIARMGMLRTFQQTHIYGKMTCVQNMQISSDIDANWKRIFSPFSSDVDDNADELLSFVGLYKKRFLLAGELSFGQQKLLEFAMALMKKPRMLLLDEPTAGVNPTLINGLIDRLHQANEDMGITLLVIEHNMRVIMNLAEHIYCLANGTMLAEGDPDSIQNDQRVIDAYLGN